MGPVVWLHRKLTEMYGARPDAIEQSVINKRIEIEERALAERRARKQAYYRLSGTPSAKLFEEVFQLHKENHEHEE